MDGNGEMGLEKKKRREWVSSSFHHQSAHPRLLAISTRQMPQIANWQTPPTNNSSLLPPFFIAHGKVGRKLSGEEKGF